VTSQPPPGPGEAKTVGAYLRPLRDLAAYVLVGATAVLLFVAVIRLIPGSTDGYSYRTQDSFYGFVNMATVFFPLAAVLLALLVAPRHPKAQLIVLAAVVEYAVMAFFGVLFGLLVGVINQAGNNGVRTAFEEFLVRLAWLAVLGVAAYAVFQIWRGMFQPAKPPVQAGVYGQPPQYSAGAYPGQPGYGPGQPGFPPAGQPGFPPQGQPGFPPPGAQYPPQPAGPDHGQGVYGQPPAWNQSPAAMPGAAPDQAAYPASAPPVSPASAPPVPPRLFSQRNQEPAQEPAQQPSREPSQEPTQVVTPQHPAEDRTQVIGEDRPGFGPAGQDPPRH
jgi:hypothetical protein